MSTERTPLIPAEGSTTATKQPKIYPGRALFDSDEEQDAASVTSAASNPEGESNNMSPSTSIHSIVKARIRNAGNRKSSQSSARNKKKASAQANAKTPLLASATPERRRPSTVITALCYALLVFMIILLLALALVHFFVGRTIARIMNDPAGLEALGQRGLVYTAPSYLQIDGIDDQSVQMTVKGKAGVDVARALQWQEGGLIGRTQRKLIRWGVRRTKQVRIASGQVQFCSPSTGDAVLMQLDSIPEFTLPVRYEEEYSSELLADPTWLKELTMPLTIKMVNSQAIATFVNSSWTNQLARIHVTVHGVDARPQGLFRRFGKLATVRLDTIGMSMKHKIPDLPFLEDPSRLVNLTSYAMTTSEAKKHQEQQMYISGNASVKNPLISQRKDIPTDLLHLVDSLGNATYSLPQAIPFNVFLLARNATTNVTNEVQFAKVNLNPFDFYLKEPQIPVSIFGVIAPEQPTPPELDIAMSFLLSRYLEGKETPIHIKPIADSALPSFLHPLIESSPTIPMSIPGSPNPDAQLLQNVRIEKMRIDGTSPTGDILCSGTVMGELFLPPGLDGLNSVLDIKRLWPDVLVFDGSPPNYAPPMDRFPPALYPAGAFARLKPEDWTKAYTEVIEVSDPDHVGRRINVTRIQMGLEEVPMSVLPGRSDIFRGYIAKILFGAGSGPQGDVLTGVWGISNATAQLPSLGRMELNDVFIKGEFFASKRSL